MTTTVELIGEYYRRELMIKQLCMETYYQKYLLCNCMANEEEDGPDACSASRVRGLISTISLRVRNELQVLYKTDRHIENIPRDIMLECVLTIFNRLVLDVWIQNGVFTYTHIRLSEDTIKTLVRSICRKNSKDGNE